ncbi:unnamed protein product [Medioppia subpectinata]|uniref:Uncharacterized protein n=1 Tax=Medioppia subpectinata TaxID=1979941 RepID=A0A7R9KSA9_9ACAR|nr:unnamed protein product [Medioppia subpectinata]CAG2108472.1 unnamed protein product [Medioppia subpectinata]
MPSAVHLAITYILFTHSLLATTLNESTEKTGSEVSKNYDISVSVRVPIIIVVLLLVFAFIFCLLCNIRDTPTVFPMRSQPVIIANSNRSETETTQHLPAVVQHVVPQLTVANRRQCVHPLPQTRAQTSDTSPKEPSVESTNSTDISEEKTQRVVISPIGTRNQRRASPMARHDPKIAGLAATGNSGQGMRSSSPSLSPPENGQNDQKPLEFGAKELG